MPASLEFDDYLVALRAAAARLREDTARLSDDRPVPTCPDWSVRQLIAHTGMVHRWAAGIVRGDLTAANSKSGTARVQDEGLHTADPGAWLTDGADALARALEDAPDDLDRFFFLNNAPPPKIAWARRQCHETTIHAVDGLSARLGCTPSAAEAAVDADVAADGIDELLAGFATRGGEELQLDDGTLSVVVQPVDVDRCWTVRLGDGPMACEQGDTEPHPDGRLVGTTAQLYLGLWNRGAEISQEGADLLSLWHDRMHVEWG